jgi:hypothetical protein
MKRAVLLLLSLFLAAACGDLPTATSAPDLVDAGPMFSGECIPNGDGLYICPPISGGGGGECDEYHYDCGGDDCISSTGPGDPHSSTVQGCTGGSGGSGTIGDGGGTGGGGGGSGGNQSPWCPANECDPPPDDGVPADDERADCIDLGCQLRDPTTAERQRVLDLIGTLRTDGFCAEVRESAMRMVNRRLQVGDNRVRYTTGGTLYGAAPWDYTRGGQVMYLWTGALTAWTIAHEAIHGIWNPSGLGHWYSHGDITPAGLDLDATAGYCSGH